jgi:hypothetical protein
VAEVIVLLQIGGDPSRLVWVSITFAARVYQSDRIIFDAPCAKCIFDSFRHFAPVGSAL